MGTPGGGGSRSMTDASEDPRVEKVKEIVNSKKVAIFMKGLPEAPMCGFSARACAVLEAAGVRRADLAAFNVLADDPMWDALERYTQWPTVPQVFIKGQFVGGCDIVAEMFESGELERLLAE
jgi:monothiol glutaredoxin